LITDSIWQAAICLYLGCRILGEPEFASLLIFSHTLPYGNAAYKEDQNTNANPNDIQATFHAPPNKQKAGNQIYDSAE
jgi:hypothetical protein